MSTSSDTANISNVPMLNGTNFKDWKENIKILLGCMDLDLALWEPKPDAITDTSSESDQAYMGSWERSNRLSLMTFVAAFQRHLGVQCLMKLPLLRIILME
ncbi:unnamed protein product [Rhodiola kirilowii]